MLARLKRKFYNTAIRPAMTYKAKCWPIRKQNMQKMNAVGMRMLRWMCGETTKDKIQK